MCNSYAVILPQPDERESEVETGARVVVCLRSAGAALDDELRAAGFVIEHLPELPDVCEVVEFDEAVIVLCDTSDREWLRALSDLVVLRPGAQPILLASLDSDEEFLAALAAGVAGFCAPDAAAKAIVRTIDSVERMGSSIPRDMVPLLVQHVRHGRGREVHTGDGVIDVTEREWAILQLLMQRRSTREMADALFVSVGTVRSHVSTLLKKLGAADRDDAVSLVEHARRNGDE